MRRVMLLAAMLAMVLAAAAPVFAQDVSIDTGDTTQYNAVCQNIIGQVGDLTAAQGGAAAAGNLSAMNNSAAVADVAQQQGVSVAQVNACLNNVATAAAIPAVAAQVQYGGGTATVTALPPTGGPSLPSGFALGAGALLVAGGLLARRIAR